MLATLTGLGLSAAAGLNAYIPFLVVALVARFTDVITLPQGWAWIESPWAIGVGVVLLLAEVVLDKIAIVDSFNDAVQTVVRPASAGIIVAATTAAQDYETASTFMQDNSWVGIVLGVGVALLVHSGKASVRPVVNAGTLGTGAPVVSTAEDTASIGLSLVAVFLPILVLVVLLGLAVLAFWFIRRRAARRTVRRGRGPAQP
ncbi:DUF4126 domain-containing protein [Nocardioides daphniae]|uniref:DUF4126 domain-containing protein n=1 Tax=Nocardioides daphniae TaxID=402297 RepID=A0A4P7UJY9_9ACTN|nr:DUF4126 domain-containing protein [Nocardioides daphniae]QCC78599.1 DUF4126 domain-containing protein [Nocardioides daphniae]GGD05984.1 hypothetical protein GCM10007231_00880 [Nocardioides daphniae]